MIYFVTDGEYVKIGFTDKDDVQQRLNALQIGNARELKLLGTILGGREEEALLHRVFDGFRVRGEWFMTAPPVDESTTTPKNIEELTPSQLRVYQTVKDNPGVNNAEIGRMLGITRQAVQGHIKAMSGLVSEVRK